MNHKTIFTFWEPKGNIVPYLRLCLKTWEANLPGYEFVILDHSNLGDYLSADALDLSVLKRLRLPMQKDAIEVAVMHQHGGIFMDVDTLAVRDITPITARLRDTEVVLFNTHVGFMAARPNARLLSQWLEGIRAQFARLKTGALSPATLPWDYIGNSVLNEVMEGMVRSLGTDRLMRLKLLRRGADAYRRFLAATARRAPMLARVLSRIEFSFLGRRRQIVFGTFYRHRLRMLDRRKHGFIAEVARYRSDRMPPDEKYRKLWFEDKLDVATVLRSDPMVIGLHNSWTPEWYKALSEEDVLAHDCLLSKTLRHILRS